MSNQVEFKVPESCPFCGVAGRVRAETTVSGDKLTVQWCCRACNKGWPVTPSDETASRDLVAVPHDRRVTYRRKIHRPK